MIRLTEKDFKKLSNQTVKHIRKCEKDYLSDNPCLVSAHIAEIKRKWAFVDLVNKE